MQAIQQPIYTVTVRQNGSGGLFLMARADVDALYRAIYEEGAIVAVWQAAGGQSVGLILNPTLGGLSLSMAPAGPIPVDDAGNMVDVENATRTIGPENFPLAKVITPAWFLRALSGDARPPHVTPPPAPGAAPTAVEPAPVAAPAPSPIPPVHNGTGAHT